MHVTDKVSKGSFQEIPKEFLQNLNIMRKSSAKDENLDGMFGKITDVNIWDYGLGKDEMEKWIQCDKTLEGNVVNWNISKWNITDLFVETIEYKSLCDESDIGLTILPLTRNFQDTIDICKSFGGTIAIGDNEETLSDMGNLIKQNGDICPNKRVYAGYSDLRTEGRFVDAVKGLTLENPNWNIGDGLQTAFHCGALVNLMICIRICINLLD